MFLFNLKRGDWMESSRGRYRAMVWKMESGRILKGSGFCDTIDMKKYICREAKDGKNYKKLFSMLAR